MEAKPLVSVIIPVYNAENTLHIVLKSLLKQNYLQLQIIMINDCSKDNTFDVILEFIPLLEDRGMIAKVISHKQNQGVAAARNTGLEHATGEYIYYVDADDYIEQDAIDILVKEAVSKNADIVGCNWFLTFEKSERKMNQPSFTTPLEAIQNMLNGSMRWNLWLFMVRRSLYIDHHVRFTPGMNMGEDLLMTVKLFTVANIVSYVNKPLYHYGQSNDQSLTKTYSIDHIKQVTANVNAVEKLLLESKYADQLANLLDFLKLNIKLPLLISDQKEQYQRWLDWFPEANHKVMENKELSFRTRLIQWLAVKEQFWAIKLYYRVVIQFVYGRLYK